MGLNWQHCIYQLSLRELDGGWKPFVSVVLCSFLYWPIWGTVLPAPCRVHPLSSLPFLPPILSLPQNRFSLSGPVSEWHSLPWIAIDSQLIQRFSTRSTQNFNSNIPFDDLSTEGIVSQLYWSGSSTSNIFVWGTSHLIPPVLIEIFCTFSVFPREFRNNIIKKATAAFSKPLPTYHYYIFFSYHLPLNKLKMSLSADTFRLLY